jgi:hypothetical protein
MDRVSDLITAFKTHIELCHSNARARLVKGTLFDVVALQQIIQLSGRRNNPRKDRMTALFIVGLVIVALWLARVMLKEK